LFKNIMGKPTGFLEYDRQGPSKREVNLRKNDYQEVEENLPLNQVVEQAARCMDCGTPFCHSGCPLGNIIPEFNDAVYSQNWAYAYEILASTNNFPEFTGRICPAPCESSCVLGINKPPVAIEHIEKSIIEYAFKHNLVQAKKPIETGKKVAIVGSGPAGLAAAAQLRKAGHGVVVFERADKIGGLLRYGIPDFKLDKGIIDRRLAIMEEEGIDFRPSVNVGKDISAKNLLDEFDAVVLAGGSTVPRGIQTAKGWDTYLGKGVFPAMEFLSQQNKRVSGTIREKDHQGSLYENGEIFATDKHVFVIGGGDTGSDCVGTSNRHKATKITQIEVMEEPKLDDKKQPFFQFRDERSPWPNWPITKRTSTSHEEGCERLFSIAVLEFLGDGQKLTHIQIGDIVWKLKDGKMQSEVVNIRTEPCDLAFVAAGFVSLDKNELINDLEEMGMELTKDVRQIDVIKTQPNGYQTSLPKVFAAGDIRRGQSLVVWAISEGREAARVVDSFLTNKPSNLEAKKVSMMALA
jgi:glutamate synthase (NADPH) small chain